MANHAAVAQRNKMLEWLQHKPLTTIEAREELDIMQPPTRIFELKEQGHNIVTQRITQNGHHGVARYVLLAGASEK